MPFIKAYNTTAAPFALNQVRGRSKTPSNHVSRNNDPGYRRPNFMKPLNCIFDFPSMECGRFKRPMWIGILETMD